MSSNNLRVLVLDQDPVQLEEISSQLSSLGYTPIICGHCQQAIDALATTPPDMALLDSRLLDQAPTDFCQRIRGSQTDSFIPIVILLPQKDPLARDLAEGLGADDCLVGPLDPLIFRLKVESMFRLRGLMLRLSHQNRDLKKLDELKRNFLAMISHELRTPLAKISGLGDNLAAGVYGNLPEETLDVVNRIKREAGHLNDMLAQILEISKTSIGDRSMSRTQVDIIDLVPLAIADQSELSDRIDHFPVDNLPAIWLDVTMMRDVLAHLIGNAGKFSPGRIKIRYHLVKDDFPTLFTSVHTPLGTKLKAGASYLGIEVVDEGPGIPVEHLPHIFEKFYQIDSSSTRVKAGLGIGLSFVEKVVQLHGGLICVGSEPDKGTSFLILLPVDLRGSRN